MDVIWLDVFLGDVLGKDVNLGSSFFGVGILIRFLHGEGCDGEVFLPECIVRMDVNLGFLLTGDCHA